MFWGIPFTTRTKLEGHQSAPCMPAAVRTDYYMETGDQSLWKTLEHTLGDLQSTEYITGGVGARAAGEAFGEP